MYKYLHICMKALKYKYIVYAYILMTTLAFYIHFTNRRIETQRGL